MKRCQDGSVNVVIGEHFQKHELELFKATEADSDPINFCDAQTSLPQLLKTLGLFTSISQAKKAGWDKQIDEGWNEFVVGRNRTKLFILKRVVYEKTY